MQILQFISVKQKLYYNVYIFIYKILNNKLSISLRNKIEILGSESQKQTASKKYRVRITKNYVQKAYFMKELKCTIPYQDKTM